MNVNEDGSNEQPAIRTVEEHAARIKALQEKHDEQLRADEAAYERAYFGTGRYDYKTDEQPNDTGNYCASFKAGETVSVKEFIPNPQVTHLVMVHGLTSKVWARIAPDGTVSELNLDVAREVVKEGPGQAPHSFALAAAVVAAYEHGFNKGYETCKVTVQTHARVS